MGAGTAEEVRAITGSKLTDTQIEPFLMAANCVVTGALSCMTAKGVSADCAAMATNWLASHLLSVSGVGQGDRVKSEEKFENYSVKWAQSQITGQGIMSTSYGETANMLTMGCLQEADKAPALICSFG